MASTYLSDADVSPPSVARYRETCESSSSELDSALSPSVLGMKSEQNIESGPQAVNNYYIYGGQGGSGGQGIYGGGGGSGEGSTLQYNIKTDNLTCSYMVPELTTVLLHLGSFMDGKAS
ncbi:hypothetical protein MSAN_00459700 [Mycena sanguinolenta]|uniref:Uncharacterized protein n=1 Tax=Mycena sanguinolenta TaxID=230812 RepID=A0A8H7DKI5_9AGAR|nr:hypothetical protein MSAN_00459700 [Mycena sanguinolenta]